jgi:hypothetical protein
MKKQIVVAVGLAVGLGMITPVMNEAMAAPDFTSGLESIPGDKIAARRKRRWKRAAQAKAAPKARPVTWVYMAKRMRPPKSGKWTQRWNTLGNQGWELVGVSENIFIFKRPSHWAVRASAPAVSSAPAAAPQPASAMPAQVKSKVRARGSKYAPSKGKVYQSGPGRGSVKSRY